MIEAPAKAMDPHHHRHDARGGNVRPIRSSIIVVSDTRGEQNDTSGVLIAELLSDAGCIVAERIFLKDEIQGIQARVIELCKRNEEIAAEADVVILTGGTGIAPRDITPQAVEPLLDRMLPGFGEAFRRISYDEVGTRGLLSRAFAGIRLSTVVFALPGSKNACRTAVADLIVPMLPHVIGLLGGARGGVS